MSRYKFEEWFEEFVHTGKSTKQIMHEAWLAGRESMRDEAAETCQTMADGWDDVAEEFGMRLSERAIRKIEP